MAKKQQLNTVLKKRLKSKLVLRPEILMGPNIPKPMHGVAPRAVLGTKWWNATRKECYKSTHYRCVACGVYKGDAKGPKWLEAHELYEIDYERGCMVYVEAVSLCHYCHSFVHDGRMKALVDKEKMTHDKYAKVMRHGTAILTAAGLSRLTHEERVIEIENLLLDGFVAPWGDWRLVLYGKEYPPKFKSEAMWQKAMSR